MAKVLKLKELDSAKGGAEKAEVTGFEAMVPQIREIDKQMEELKGKREDLRGIIMNKVVPMMREGLSRGYLVKTYIVNSEDEKPATVLFKNMYSKLDPSNEAPMREVMGPLFDKFFTKTTDYTMKSSANKNELKKLLGDRFSEFFEDVEALSFTKEFMEQRAGMHDQLNANSRKNLDEWMAKHQANPDLRMK